ncbi:predicted protein [Enterococcus gallinarum EG2]|nr:predicted protein [Enterococcus gallinarum EG2]
MLLIVIETPRFKLLKNTKILLELLSFLLLCAKMKKIKNANSHFFNVEKVGGESWQIHKNPLAKSFARSAKSAR